MTDARRAIEDWDPFAETEANHAPGVALGADDAPRTKPRKKDRRSPMRGMSRALQQLVGQIADETAYVDEDGDRHNTWIAIIAIANAFNIKTDKAWELWRNRNNEKWYAKVSTSDRRQAEKSATAIRQLEPMRHLIALAMRPVEAEDGEIDAVAAALQSLAIGYPELRLIIADVALLLDMAAQMRELVDAIRPRLFGIYEQLVEAEPTMRQSLVVNWCRDHKATSGIYPDGGTRFREDEDDR